MTVKLSLCLVLAATLCTPFFAFGEPKDAGRFYTGGTIGAGLLAGPSILSDSSYKDRLGFTTGVHARVSSVLQVVDTALEYSHDSHQFQSNSDSKINMSRHSLSIIGMGHPFFLRILGNNRFWYTVASWTIQIGLGVNWTTLTDDNSEIRQTDTAFAAQLGTGIETPLDDPNDGGGFWLGISCRWKAVFMEPKIVGHDNLDAYSLMMVLSYRNNNISAARVRRPPELKYR